MSTSNDGHARTLSQAERFAQTARDAECDEDEGRWEDRLKAIARQKPKDEAEKPD